MKTYTYTKTNEMFERAKKVMPSGIYGHLKPVNYFPHDAYPFYIERAQGAYFYDLDGNKLIDFMCAYGPNVLGYCDPDVDGAVREQMKLGDLVSLPSYRAVEVAEKIVDTIESADWAIFARNGTDVTNASLSVARKATGRNKVVLVRGSYHGTAPWAQIEGTAEGIFNHEQANNIYIRWNDVEQFEQVIRDNPGQIAAYIATPYYIPIYAPSELPAEGYWEKVRKLCTDNGIVLIIDDVRHSYRLDLKGSDKYYGFKADLTCHCKALANGWTVSALCGVDALKDVMASINHTGSYWMSTVPFVAAMATIDKLVKIDGANYMQRIGKMYTDGLIKLADQYGYYLDVTGVPSLFNLYLAKDKDSANYDFSSPASSELHKTWIGECGRRGSYMASWHNLFTCCAMTEDDINHALNIADEAFKAVKSKF